MLSIMRLFKLNSCSVRGMFFSINSIIWGIKEKKLKIKLPSHRLKLRKSKLIIPGGLRIWMRGSEGVSRKLKNTLTKWTVKTPKSNLQSLPLDPLSLSRICEWEPSTNWVRAGDQGWEAQLITPPKQTTLGITSMEWDREF